MNDPSFNVYHRVAKKFGFLIDLNQPTRLIFNLNSPAARRYFNLYGQTSKPYYRDASGDFSEVASQEGHVHNYRYTIFGDERGEGYTTNVLHNGQVFAAGNQVHVHQLSDFTNIGAAKTFYDTIDHIHKIVPIEKQQVFETFYERSIFSEIDGPSDGTGLRQILYVLYSKFVRAYPTVKSYEYSSAQACKLPQRFKDKISEWRYSKAPVSKSSHMAVEKSKRMPLVLNEFNTVYNFNYFLPVYVRLRLIEAGVKGAHKISEHITNETRKNILLRDHVYSLRRLEYFIDKAMVKDEINEEYERIFS